jgi:methyltransferase (TIGR00027 family)
LSIETHDENFAEDSKMAILVHNMFQEVLMHMLPLLTLLGSCLVALYCIGSAKPSRSAVVVLEMRALGAKLPDVDLRNGDTLASSFFGARERQALVDAHMPTFIDLNLVDAWNNLGSQRRLFVHVLARTRIIDDTLCAEIRDGAVQVVVLGAGYDTRAYRMQELLKRAIVFEVDLLPIQELKKLQVREVLDQIPNNVVFVPTDFTNGELGTVLPKAGYHAEQRTVFVLEGVSYHLPESSVDAILRFVASNSAPGSTIIFDYESERVPRGDHDDEELKEIMARLSRWGEPHVFGLPVGNARAFVEQRGLLVVADLGPRELTRKYLSRKDGTLLAEEPWHFAVCVARVPGREEI